MSNRKPIDKGKGLHAKRARAEGISLKKEKSDPIGKGPRGRDVKVVEKETRVKKVSPPYMSEIDKPGHGFNLPAAEKTALFLTLRDTERWKTMSSERVPFRVVIMWYMVRYSPARHTHDHSRLPVNEFKLCREFESKFVLPPPTPWDQATRYRYTLRVRDYVHTVAGKMIKDSRSSALPQTGGVSVWRPKSGTHLNGNNGEATNGDDLASCAAYLTRVVGPARTTWGWKLHRGDIVFLTHNNPPYDGYCLIEVFSEEGTLLHHEVKRFPHPPYQEEVQDIMNRVVSQLNGNNGEWTNGDDMASGGGTEASVSAAIARMGGQIENNRTWANVVAGQAPPKHKKGKGKGKKPVYGPKFSDSVKARDVMLKERREESAPLKESSSAGPASCAPDVPPEIHEDAGGPEYIQVEVYWTAPSKYMEQVSMWWLTLWMCLVGAFPRALMLRWPDLRPTLAHVTSGLASFFDSFSFEKRVMWSLGYLTYTIEEVDRDDFDTLYKEVCGSNPNTNSTVDNVRWLAGSKGLDVTTLPVYVVQELQRRKVKDNCVGMSDCGVPLGHLNDIVPGVTTQVCSVFRACWQLLKLTVVTIFASLVLERTLKTLWSVVCSTSVLISASMYVLRLTARCLVLLYVTLGSFTKSAITMRPWDSTAYFPTALVSRGMSLSKQPTSRLLSLTLPHVLLGRASSSPDRLRGSPMKTLTERMLNALSESAPTMSWIHTVGDMASGAIGSGKSRSKSSFLSGLSLERFPGLSLISESHHHWWEGGYWGLSRTPSQMPAPDNWYSRTESHSASYSNRIWMYWTTSSRRWSVALSSYSSQMTRLFPSSVVMGCCTAMWTSLPAIPPTLGLSLNDWATSSLVDLETYSTTLYNSARQSVRLDANPGVLSLNLTALSNSLVLSLPRCLTTLRASPSEPTSSATTIPASHEPTTESESHTSSTLSVGKSLWSGKTSLRGFNSSSTHLAAVPLESIEHYKISGSYYVHAAPVTETYPVRGSDHVDISQALPTNDPPAPPRAYLPTLESRRTYAAGLGNTTSGWCEGTLTLDGTVLWKRSELGAACRLKVPRILSDAELDLIVPLSGADMLYLAQSLRTPAASLREQVMAMWSATSPSTPS